MAALILATSLARIAECGWPHKIAVIWIDIPILRITTLIMRLTRVLTRVLAHILILTLIRALL